MNNYLLRLPAAALLGLCAFVAQASTTYDFTSGGTSYTPIGSGFGNALDFGDMTANAWATTGVPYNSNNLLGAAQILSFNTGLGVCNENEGMNCPSPTHQVDNVGDDDLVMFFFDQQMTFDSIVIDPFGLYDRDVTYWIADITAVQSDLTGFDPNTLFDGTSIFGNRTTLSHPAGSAPLTVSLGAEAGNVLLFAGKFDPGNKKDNDRFKIASLTATVVPVPAAVWLFATGLIGLVGVARRKHA